MEHSSPDWPRAFDECLATHAKTGVGMDCVNEVAAERVFVRIVTALQTQFLPAESTPAFFVFDRCSSLNAVAFRSAHGRSRSAEREQSLRTIIASRSTEVSSVIHRRFQGVTV